jgi:hypothetical protein
MDLNSLETLVLDDSLDYIDVVLDASLKFQLDDVASFI